MNQDDDAYLAMLNNKIINPPRDQSKAATADGGSPEEKTAATSTAPATSFDALTAARENITEISKQLMLISEADAPFEWISADWDSNDPPTIQQLVDLGWVDPHAAEEYYNTKTFPEFFEPLMDPKDPYGQAEQYRALYKRMQTMAAGRVFLVGKLSITVLIIGIVSAPKKKALAGLRSLLVQT
ncbi:hypothetical protein BX666DRAFT_1858606 [Dichotomocladium elegans]|nr:hypothetical protein BX666DRAFT_1858606 [Dichotomocladium elegans]